MVCVCVGVYIYYIYIYIYMYIYIYICVCIIMMGWFVYGTLQSFRWLVKFREGLLTNIRFSKHSYRGLRSFWQGFLFNDQGLLLFVAR